MQYFFLQYNMSCLGWAAGRGHLEVLKALLVKGARANSADKVSFAYIQIRDFFLAENCSYFLTRQYKHVFWVLKRTVSKEPSH